MRSESLRYSRAGLNLKLDKVLEAFELLSVLGEPWYLSANVFLSLHRFFYHEWMSDSGTNTSIAPVSRNESQNSLLIMRGWVNQPGQRGSLDIIWSCVATIFICVWVVIHLNVPAADDNRGAVFLRRLRWSLLAILAPELVMLFACGQWASAKRSVTDMTSLGFTDWTMVHAFYADSGGFMLQSQDCIPFPITAKQIKFLVQKKYISCPTITRKEIWDKSKADRLAKVIASLQAGWLVIQVTGRGMQRLPITLLELSTVALITCAGATMFFWFYKPLDVQTPTFLESKRRIADILKEAGEAAKEPFQDTPLDFVEGQLYTSSQMPLSKYWGVQERPLPRIPNDRDSRLHNLHTVLIVAVPTASFSLLHLAGWNFEFPTRAEQLLWRWNCISSGIILGIGCTVEAISIIWDHYTTTGLTNLNGYKLKWPTNLLFIVPGALYFCGRMIVIAEIFLSLRLLPRGCFQTVDWLELVPHF